jgi:hypothetical protein
MKLIKIKDVLAFNNKIYLGSANNKDYYLELSGWILVVSNSSTGTRRFVQLPIGFKKKLQTKDDEYFELAVEKAKRLLILK